MKAKTFSAILTALLFSSSMHVNASIPHKSASERNIHSAEAKAVQMINDERAKKGYRPLRIWKALTLSARKHSQNMAHKRVAFGHNGFEERGNEIKKIAPWKAFGENVAYSYNVKDHLQTAVTGWMNSPGHRENILGNFEETGMGIAFSKDGSFYITQLFATRFSR